MNAYMYNYVYAYICMYYVVNMNIIKAHTYIDADV